MTIYKFLVGVVLTVAMIAVLGMAALVFSSRDFQFGVAQISNTSGLISFQKLADADRQIQQIQAASAGPRGEKLQIDQRLADLQAQATKAENDSNAARAAVVGQIADIESRTNAQPPQALIADPSVNALNQRLGLLSNHQLSPGDQRNLTSLRGQVQQISEQQQAHDNTSAEQTELLARQQLVGGQVAESDRQILALEQQVLPDAPQQFTRIRNEALALQNLSPLGVSAYLAQGSPSILATLLVLLFGALGSLLYLFPAYLNRPQPVTMAEIAVRLIFGMCAALAFYVLANATIAGFAISTNVVQASTSSTLNPFTVALIGTIAGVLSEDIAKWIQDRGKGIFTQGGAAAAPAATDDSANFSGVNPHGGPGAP
jgi:hypothetical protein